MDKFGPDDDRATAGSANEPHEAKIIPLPQPAAPKKTDVAAGPIEPPIDLLIVRQFVIAENGKARLVEWARQAYHAANPLKYPSHTEDEVDEKRTQHFEEIIERLRGVQRAHDIVQVNTHAEEAFSKAGYARFMLLVTYAFIALGFFVLNWTLSTYLINSGMFVDYVEHAWKASIFCSLPLTAAFGLKAISGWLSDSSRRRLAMTLGWIGAATTLVWIASFSWLFAPRGTTPALALPGDGVTSEQLIGVALVFAHLTGEIALAALLGMAAKKLWLGNRKRELQLTPEFKGIEVEIEAWLRELEEVGARQHDRGDYLRRFEAGLQAFTLRAEALFDRESKRLHAAQASALLKFFDRGD
jgi:hypothetical protein